MQWSEWVLGAFLLGGLIRFVEERIRQAQVAAAAAIPLTREEGADLEKMLDGASWPRRLRVHAGLLLLLVAPRSSLARVRRQLAAWRASRVD
jgi:hypothetical protein